MKNWTIKDYQKDTVSIDLFFFLQKVEPGQRGMCCEDISNLCISNSWAGEQSLKNRSGKFKKTGARSATKSSGVLAEVQVADEPTQP